MRCRLLAAVDAAGAVYVAGTTGSASFPATPGAFDTRNKDKAGFDVFAARLSP